MAPKVFGIGIHRTGSTTLAECLRILGYRHAPYAGELLPEVLAGRSEAALERIAAHDSFSDWPWSLLYRQIEQRHPDARFILPTRKDSDTWYASLCGHAARTGPTTERTLIYGHPEPQGRRHEYGRFYEQHNRDVLSHFAGRPEALLPVCWETGSGWAQLCAFLDKDVPAGPFPHARQGISSAPRAARRPAPSGARSAAASAKAAVPGSAEREMSA